MVNDLFTAEDHLKIHEAVQAAERRTRGEIVPMVVMASARYRETAHLAGLVALFIVLVASLMLRGHLAQLPWQVNAEWLILTLALGYVIGASLGSIPVIIRCLTAEQRMAMKVRLRAEQSFYQKGLHRTREGTGILIFVSLLERRVLILADRALDNRVPPETWKALADQLARDIKSGEVVTALCQAIAAAGVILEAHVPARSGDNPNELGDTLIQDR